MEHDIDKNKNNKTKNRLPVILTLIGVLILLLVLAFFLISQLYEREQYPVKYIGEIKSASEKYNLDPYLVMAVIHRESGFRADVASNKGAVGLMQIMPSTGEWIAGKLKIEYNEAALKEPEYNIELGCWYLSYLSDTFDGNTENILCGYNAGPNKTKSWLKEYSQDGKTLDNIPYPETEKYVSKVKTSIEKYKQIYPGAFE